MIFFIKHIFHPSPFPTINILIDKIPEWWNYFCEMLKFVHMNFIHSNTFCHQSLYQCVCLNGILLLQHHAEEQIFVGRTIFFKGKDQRGGGYYFKGPGEGKKSKTRQLYTSLELISSSQQTIYWSILIFVCFLMLLLSQRRYVNLT